MASDDTKTFCHFIGIFVAIYAVIFGFTFLLVGSLYYARDNPLVQNYRNTSCHIMSTESRTYKCGKNRLLSCYEIEWKLQHGDEDSIWSVIIDKVSISSQVSKRLQAFAVRNHSPSHECRVTSMNERIVSVLLYSLQSTLFIESMFGRLFIEETAVYLIDLYTRFRKMIDAVTKRRS